MSASPDPSRSPEELPKLDGRPLVVLGDAHLHERCDPGMAADLERLVTAAPHRSVIVFNGDLFDLDRVHGDPAAGVGEAVASQRLERILARHATLVAVLRIHVQQGGRLVFVAGNHDAELLLAGVRQKLIDRLGDDDSVFVLEGLRLGPVTIEHGHQTDPDAAFFPETRTAVQRQRLSAFPLASLMTRLFVSEHPRYEAAGLHYEAPLPVFLGVLRNYKLAGLWMAIAYPFVALRITWQSVLARVRSDVPTRPGPLSMSSPWQVVRRLYLDRYFMTVGAIAVLVSLLAGWMKPGFWWLFGAMAVYLVVPPARRRSTFGERDIRTTADEAARLAAHGARVVVFGHTHRAFLQQLDAATYANHGAFSIPIEIDEGGTVCSDGKRAPRSVDPSRKGRPYLLVSVEPPTCELRALRLQARGSRDAPTALM